MPRWHRSIVVVAVLMVLFGGAEVATAFTGNFFGVISTSPSVIATTVGAVAGSLYVIGGLATLTMKKWGAVLSICCIGGEILGRVYLVASGLYPFYSTNAASIIGGTGIAFGFVFYILLQWRKFG